MRAILIYTTKHGTTLKVANTILHSSKHNISLNNLKKNSNPNLENYELVIIGSSLHAGSISRKMKKYLKHNENILLSKKLAIYLCGMQEAKTEEQFSANFSEKLRNHSFATTFVGGEFLFEKMNFVQKSIIKKISGVEESVSRIKDDALQEFIHALRMQQ
jgi:menaquinone-dependent protoporphyrinogen oxidase